MTDTQAIERAPPLGMRLAFATIVALLAAIVAARAEFRVGANGGDHLILWNAAHEIFHGVDPYHLGAGGTLPDPFDRLFYPLPTVALGVPFAWLSVPIAAVCFTVTGAALFVFVLTREGFERAPIVLSVPFLVALQFAQTTPYIVAFALMPALAGLSFLKPNLGLALFLRSPKRNTIVVAAVLVLASLIVVPKWPAEWLLSVRSSHNHHAPVANLVGAIGLAGLLRWRRPEARLLVAMTLIPHGVPFYDEIPLWLVASTRREAMLLSLLSWIGALACVSLTGNMNHAGPWIGACLYAPATWLVLRRPNEGPLPAWLEAIAQNLPRWLRGSEPAQRLSGAG